MKTHYTISELSRDFAITTRAIRFYEDEGLLSPTRRGRARIYTHKDKVRLRLIIRGKRLGFSLQETKAFFDMYDAVEMSPEKLHQFLQKIHQRRALLLQQQQDITAVLGELDAAEAKCLEILEEQAEQGRRLSQQNKQK